MKIGIDARLWNETGVGRYIQNLVGHLDKIDSHNEYVLFCLTSSVSSIKYKVLNNKWKIVPVDIRWHSVKEQIEFPMILNRENLDLVHFPYFSLPILYNRPFIVTIHDLIIHHYPTGKASTLPLPAYYLKRAGYKAVLNQVVKKAKQIIVPLNCTKDDLVKSLKVDSDKVVVTYEGVDESLAKNKEQKAKGYDELDKYFLYVGNAYPHKNLDTLIKAFKKVYGVNSKKPQLILVGKEDYFYKQLINRINIEHIEGVKILHNIDDGTLSQLYKNALAVIAPSFMEGFGLVPLEAMANECLVVVSDIPSHREVCDDTVIFFNPKDPEDLSERLSDIIRNFDSSMYKNKIKSGKERVKLFSWKKMAQDTLKIYEQFEK